MKKLLLVLFAVTTVFGADLSAQTPDYGPNADECKKYISFYSDYYKQKNYDAALPSWRKAYSICPPTARYSILQHGGTLMKYLIKKNQLNPEYRDQLVDSLMVIYQKRIEFWPKYRNSSLNNYALDLYNYYKDSPEKLYKGLNEVVNQLGAETDLKTFPIYMKVACDLCTNGGIDVEEVIKAYENSTKYLSEVNVEGNEIKKKALEKAQSEVNAIFSQSGVASSDNLVNIYGPKFEAAPSVELAKSIVSQLAKAEGGMETDLFVTTLAYWYENEPSASAAETLYKLYNSRGDVANAVRYLEEAIKAEEGDDAEDANRYHQLAVISYKDENSSKAVAAATKAIELSDEYDGKCYLLIANIWASVKCTGNEIEQRAKYWVATDYMNKAKAADPSLTEDCNSSIAHYRVFYPQTAEAFMYDITDGQSYKVTCGGMSAVTTVRTQK